MHIIVVGCGRVGSALADHLSRKGHDVVVIDRNPEAFKELGENFNGVTLAGDGFDIEVLNEAGIKTADVLCSATSSDNVNIIAAQIARKVFSIPHVVARIYDARSAEIYSRLGVTIISGTELLAAMMNNKILSDRFSAVLLQNEEVGVMEFKANSKLAGKTVAEIDDPPQLKLIAIMTDGHLVIPKPDATVAEGDILVCAVRKDRINKLDKQFNRKLKIKNKKL
jgi:trk system potassium uptake protein TrkA